MIVQLPLLNGELVESGRIEVPDILFAREWCEPLAHRLMVANAANARRATRKQLSRGEIRSSTKKLYPQKHRGKARVGSAGSPTRRGGGRAFPNSPSDNFARRLNRKEFRAGMATILSQLARENRIAAAESLIADRPATKPYAVRISSYAGSGRLLFVDTEFELNFALSVRNLARTSLVVLDRLLAADLLRHSRVVISRRGVEKIGGMWA